MPMLYSKDGPLDLHCKRHGKAGDKNGPPGRFCGKPQSGRTFVAYRKDWCWRRSGKLGQEVEDAVERFFTVARCPCLVNAFFLFFGEVPGERIFYALDILFLLV